MFCGVIVGTVNGDIVMLGTVIVTGLNEDNIMLGFVNGGMVICGVVTVGTVNELNVMVGEVIVGTVIDAKVTLGTVTVGTEKDETDVNGGNVMVGAVIVGMLNDWLVNDALQIKQLFQRNFNICFYKKLKKPFWHAIAGLPAG